MRSKKPFSAGKPTFGIFIALLLLASAIVPTQAQARKFKVLHAFHGSPTDGYFPGGQGWLVRDAAGNLYGTAGSGGKGTCGTSTCGTAFKMDRTGKEIWLHSFNGKDGMGPSGGLLRDAAGNLYGTTFEGGDLRCKLDSLGCGAVFELDPSGKETVLYRFKGMTDGLFPDSPVVQDASGNLYGTTEVGGSSGFGNVFEVDKDGKEKSLYSFTGHKDGCYPVGVILDSAGNLYGVAAQGGSAFCNRGQGVLFKLDTKDNFSVLYTFGGERGSVPDSPLLLDAEGNLYGETAYGGSSTDCPSGCGAVFQLSPGGVETVLYSFCSLSNCVDGERPGGGLSRDGAGNLYGTTIFGGSYRNCSQDSCGVVFKLDTSGKETVLHSFTAGKDGANPEQGVILDSSGAVYGMTYMGGELSCEPPSGCGVVFKISP